MRVTIEMTVESFKEFVEEHMPSDLQLSIPNDKLEHPWDCQECKDYKPVQGLLNPCKNEVARRSEVRMNILKVEPNEDGYRK